jgi:hypothetical protein
LKGSWLNMSTFINGVEENNLLDFKYKSPALSI